MNAKQPKNVGKIIEVLAKYIDSLSFNTLPHTVIQRAKTVTLDTLGVLLAASAKKYQASDLGVKFIQSVGGRPESTVVRTSLKTSCVNAAFANGTIANVIELDDSHNASTAHTAAVIIPAALAVSERMGVDGKSFIRAIVIGYDAGCRVCLSLDPAVLYKRGFHPTAIGGCFGAAAAAASILNLDKERLINALGLAGCQASGLMAWEAEPKQMSKSFQTGIASRNGVTAALLAQMGFAGPPDIFEGKYNIFNAFSGQSKPEELIKELGVRFEIMGTSLKRHACCRFIHAALDGFLEIIEYNHIKPKDIKQILLEFPKSAVPVIDNNELLSHNAQYMIAVAAVDKKIKVDQIFEDKRRDCRVLDLYKRVKVLGNLELEKLFFERGKRSSIIEVITQDGRKLKKRVDCPKGDPENFLSQEEVKEKFIDLARQVISIEQGEEIVELVDKLEKINNMKYLGALLRLKTL